MLQAVALWISARENVKLSSSRYFIALTLKSAMRINTAL